MDGLVAIVKKVLELDPVSGTLFVFIVRRRAKLKILPWEKYGFVIWYKRLERHKFHWPHRFDVDGVTLTGGGTSRWPINGSAARWPSPLHDFIRATETGRGAFVAR